MFNDFVYQVSIANISVFYALLALAAGIVIWFSLQTYRKQRKIPFLEISLLIWILFATSVIYKSSVYSLSDYACLGGFFGFFIIPLIALCDIAFSLWRSIKKSSGTWTKIFVAHVISKLIPYIIVIITSIRAVSLCTV